MTIIYLLVEVIQIIYRNMLLSDFTTLTGWFYGNYMIINPDKCSYMCLGKNKDDNLNFSEFNLRIR